MCANNAICEKLKYMQHGIRMRCIQWFLVLGSVIDFVLFCLFFFWAEPDSLPLKLNYREKMMMMTITNADTGTISIDKFKCDASRVHVRAIRSLAHKI